MSNKFVPDNQLWLRRDGGKKRLENALHWYEDHQNKRRENFTEIEKKIRDE